MLAYSFFTIASLHVLLMALLERRLHGGPLPSALQKLPPLLTMETLLFRIIGAGFRAAHADARKRHRLFRGVLRQSRCASITRRCSAFFPGLSLARCSAAAHSTAGAGASRCAGRSPALWSLVLAYFGSKFVLEVLLGRA